MKKWQQFWSFSAFDFGRIHQLWLLLVTCYLLAGTGLYAFSSEVKPEFILWMASGLSLLFVALYGTPFAFIISAIAFLAVRPLVQSGWLAGLYALGVLTQPILASVLMRWTRQKQPLLPIQRLLRFLLIVSVLTPLICALGLMFGLAIFTSKPVLLVLTESLNYWGVSVLGCWFVAPLLLIASQSEQFNRNNLYTLVYGEASSGVAEEKFLALVEMSLAGVFICGIDGNIKYCNKRCAEIFGTTPERVLDFPLETFLPDLDMRQQLNDRLFNLESNEIHHFSLSCLNNYGKLIDVEVQTRSFAHQGARSLIGIVLEVGHKKTAEQQLRLTAKVFENAMEGIMIADAEARIIAVNAAFTRITGYSASDAIDKVSRMFRRVDNPNLMNEELIEALHERGHWQGEVQDIRKNGEPYTAWLSISAVRNTHHIIDNFVGVFSDITNRKEAEERLHFLANHDPLTQLPNRSSLRDKLNFAVQSAAKNKNPLAVMFIDLDRFKTINDTLGHHTGDLLLQIVADRLSKIVLPYHGLIARLGGDEFTVIIENANDNKKLEQIAEAILEELCQAFYINHQEVFVTCSIGISLYPQDGKEGSALLKNADAAMYRAKELGKNNYQFFSADMNAQAFERLMMENNLRRALERHEFELYYQPQIDFVTGNLTGLEVLIRWQHPDLGLISPAKFIPVAEETGMIVPIGEWVLRAACLQAKTWQAMGLPKVRVAINLSPRQFRQEHLVPTVRRILQETGLETDWLELEITESMIMQQPDQAVFLLEELKSMGIMLAIDDFGTGYSSLSVLKHFPIHRIKIDRSFVEGIPHNADDVSITEVIINMAHRMELEVIAEGIEKEEQIIALQKMGCNAGQGYLFGRPMTAHAVEEMLSKPHVNPLPQHTS